MLRRLLDSPWLYFALAGLLVLVALLSQLEFRSLRPLGDVKDLRGLSQRDDLNVVFIVIDTLRADHLGAYGYERPTSPTLDLLAASGVRFATVEAQSSWTKASMASLWTGLYPRSTGVTRFYDGVAQEARMPAEILRDAGFRTAGLFRNGWVSNNFGFDQGFQRYYEPKPSREPERFKRHNPSAHPLQGTDLDATQSAVEFLNNHGQERFFLYIHYMDVHQYLYDEGSALFGSDRAGSYDNAIHWTDRNLSYLARELQDRDLLSRTLIVITSDHGEGFFEHGVEGHARTLYREVTEVPLIFVLPFRLEPGIVVETPVQNVDVWPTILDLLGLPPLPGAEGHSLVPLIEAAASSGGRAEDGADRLAIADLDRSWGIVGAESRPMVSLVQGKHRFIHRTFAPEQPELFDRSEDPREQRNRAAEHPELVQELRARVEAYLATEPNWETPQVAVDDMRAAQLRALGYVIGKQQDEEAEAEDEAKPE